MTDETKRADLTAAAERLRDAAIRLTVFRIHRDTDQVAGDISLLTDHVLATVAADERGVMRPGGWRVSSEGIFNGTLRIGRFDFDTDPSDEFKEQVYREMQCLLNRQPSAQETQS